METSAGPSTEQQPCGNDAIVVENPTRDEVATASSTKRPLDDPHDTNEPPLVRRKIDGSAENPAESGDKTAKDTDADASDEVAAEVKPTELLAEQSAAARVDHPEDTRTGGVGTDPSVPFVRKRKAVILFGYNGTGYNGMQKNPGVRCIEDEILEALITANALDAENLDCPQAVQFQRTARTDKGVHAARQVVSLKMGFDDPDLKEKLNDALPNQIRVFAITRVTKNFNCKLQCTGRRYEYLAPTYAFQPKGYMMESAINFRMNDECWSKVNEVLANFVGTHNFHNFTSKKPHSDPSAERYIKSFSCSKPRMINGLEFVSIVVEGQSFLLHMIRKMVGLTMAIVRGYCEIDVLTRAWSPAKVDVPRAPGLGLLLDKPFFRNYNNKFRDDPQHTLLEWNELDNEIEEFKAKQIHSEMVETEKKERTIFNWLSTLVVHNYKATEAEPVATSNKSVTSGGTQEDAANKDDQDAQKGDSTKKKEKLSFKGGQRAGKGGRGKGKPKGPRGVCFRFLKGKCQFDNCKFSHDNSKGVLRNEETSSAPTSTDTNSTDSKPTVTDSAPQVSVAEAQ